MSSDVVNLCKELVTEAFGSTVACVASAVLAGGGNLAIINERLNRGKVGIKGSQLRKALAVLEHHNLVTFSQESNGRVTYSCEPSAVIQWSRASRCALTIKKLYGDVAEAIIEELVGQGRMQFSACAQRVASRLEFDVAEVRVQFGRLAGAQFVIRCQPLDRDKTDEGDQCPEFKPLDANAFVVPEREEAQVASTSTVERKRKLEEGGEKILWRVNWMRFDSYLRNEIVLSRIEEIGNEHCVNVVRALLKSCESRGDIVSSGSSSVPVPVRDILRCAVDNGLRINAQSVETCLNFLAEDQSRVIRRAGDSGGGMFIIDFDKALESACLSTIESIIREKYENKGVRVFKLVLAQGFLEHEQIEKLGMLSSKESKEITYSLMRDEFLSVRELPKTGDFAPARTFYLFHVELSRVARTQYNRACKMQANAVLRRRHEILEHKWLTDRQEKMETIIANIESDANVDDESKKTQVAEVSQTYLTVGDKATLDKFRKGIQALYALESEIEWTMFVLEAYLSRPSRVPPTKGAKK